jgi:spore germination protein YaaH
MRASTSSLCALGCVAILAGEGHGVSRSPWHAEHAAARAARHATLETARVAAAPQHRLTSAVGPLERMVYGYLPYWEMGYEVPHWDLLGVLAWFAVGIDATGHVIDWNGWGGAETEALVAEAHANQTPVAVTITLFDNAQIGLLLEGSASRAQTIQTCLEVMAVHSADGVNIDFEFVPSSANEAFVTFMAELKLAVTEAQPNGGDGHVTLAGPAVDWTGGYDYDQLLEVTDGIMVMGYGYHYGGGAPGPNAPLFGGGIWGPYSVAWTIADYLAHGADAHRERIFFGLPWYGMKWPVATTTVPGVSLGTGKAVWFDVALAEAAQQGATYDADSHALYYHSEGEGTLWQVWYDDPASFSEKLAYIDAQGLGGIGLWALGYEGDEGGYWQEIADHFGAGLIEEPIEVDDRDVVEDASDPDASTVDALDGEADQGPELGPEVTPSSPIERATTVQVSGVSQATFIKETTVGGCQGGGGSPVENWWALFVALSAIGPLRARRAC